MDNFETSAITALVSVLMPAQIHFLARTLEQ